MRCEAEKWENSVFPFVRFLCSATAVDEIPCTPPPLSLPLPLTQEELATLADGERKRGEKDEWLRQPRDGQLSYLVKTQ